jgi:hypothetical protein
MLLYVHSAGRGHLPLPTLDTLLASERARDVRLVLQERELGSYADHMLKLPDVNNQCIALPSKIKSLSPTRQWILENSPTTNFVLFDDDLSFATRRKDDITRFLPASRAGINRMLMLFERTLGVYAHVGLMAREGGNRVPVDARGKPVPLLKATRMMRVLGYRADFVRSTGARFDRLPTKQDFDMTLQLLRAGYENAVITEFVHNQAGSNTEGGCSAYRDEAMMTKSAHGLAKLHPGFVKVVIKSTEFSWGGGERVDVQIAWKKALASSEC